LLTLLRANVFCSQYNAILFLLPGVAGLSGATLRIPNSFLTQTSGGRNCVYSSSLLLCVPMVIAAIVLSDTDCPFNTLLACATLSGVGGGAFASSISNINFFYPKRLQGTALGFNGGFGNLGVSVSQLIAPVVMSTAYGKSSIVPSGIAGWPANAGFFWFPICGFSAFLAYFLMNNHPAHGEKSNFTNLINCKQNTCMNELSSSLRITPTQNYFFALLSITAKNLSLLDGRSGLFSHRDCCRRPYWNS
jgi:nitrate/nitrite transporter NarK